MWKCNPWLESLFFLFLTSALLLLSPVQNPIIYIQEADAAIRASVFIIYRCITHCLKIQQVQTITFLSYLMVSTGQEWKRHCWVVLVQQPKDYRHLKAWLDLSTYFQTWVVSGRPQFLINLWPETNVPGHVGFPYLPIFEDMYFCMGYI